MLVLSRKKNESIVIKSGDKTITVVIVDIQSGRVRVGLTAPKEVSIRRKDADDSA